MAKLILWLYKRFLSKLALFEFQGFFVHKESSFYQLSTCYILCNKTILNIAFKSWCFANYKLEIYGVSSIRVLNLGILLLTTILKIKDNMCVQSEFMYLGSLLICNLILLFERQKWAVFSLLQIYHTKSLWKLSFSTPACLI
jgi:hypothetical protein